MKGKSGTGSGGEGMSVRVRARGPENVSVSKPSIARCAYFIPTSEFSVYGVAVALAVQCSVRLPSNGGYEDGRGEEGGYLHNCVGQVGSIQFMLYHYSF